MQNHALPPIAQQKARHISELGRKPAFYMMKPLVDFFGRMALHSPLVDAANPTNANRWFSLFFDTLNSYGRHERTVAFRGSWWGQSRLAYIVRRQAAAVVNMCDIADGKSRNQKEAQAYLAVMVAYLDSKEHVNLKNFYARNGLYRHALDKVLKLGQQDAGAMKDALRQLVRARTWWRYERDSGYLHELFNKMAQEFWERRSTGWSRPYLLICKAALELAEEGQGVYADKDTLSDMRNKILKMESAPLPDALPARGKIGL